MTTSKHPDTLETRIEVLETSLAVMDGQLYSLERDRNILDVRVDALEKMNGLTDALICSLGQDLHSLMERVAVLPLKTTAGLAAPALLEMNHKPAGTTPATAERVELPKGPLTPMQFGESRTSDPRDEMEQVEADIGPLIDQFIARDDSPEQQKPQTVEDGPDDIIEASETTEGGPEQVYGPGYASLGRLGELSSSGPEHGTQTVEDGPGRSAPEMEAKGDPADDEPVFPPSDPFAVLTDLGPAKKGK